MSLQNSSDRLDVTFFLDSNEKVTWIVKDALRSILTSASELSHTATKDFALGGRGVPASSLDHTRFSCQLVTSDGGQELIHYLLPEHTADVLVAVKGAAWDDHPLSALATAYDIIAFVSNRICQWHNQELGSFQLEKEPSTAHDVVQYITDPFTERPKYPEFAKGFITCANEILPSLISKANLSDPLWETYNTSEEGMRHEDGSSIFSRIVAEVWGKFGERTLPEAEDSAIEPEAFKPEVD